MSAGDRSVAAHAPAGGVGGGIAVMESAVLWQDGAKPGSMWTLGGESVGLKMSCI